MYVVLGLPGMISNVGHGASLDVFGGESYILRNEFPWVEICMINHE